MLRTPPDPALPSDHVALQEALTAAERTSLAFDLLLVALGLVVVVLATRAALRRRSRRRDPAGSRAPSPIGAAGHPVETGKSVDAGEPIRRLDADVDEELRRSDRDPPRIPSPETPAPLDDSAARAPGPSRAPRRD